MLKSFSNNFILSSLELSFQLSNAFFAASTAALVSSFDPSEIIAQVSSVDGFMTSKSLGLLGETHSPFISVSYTHLTLPTKA